MPRPPLFRTNEFPYHITARTNNREWYPQPLQECWNIYKNCIAQTHHQYGFRTCAFVLMGNHYHWLMYTPLENLDPGMQFFMTQSSKRIQEPSGRINRLYGGRYSWTVIGEPDHYAAALRYVYLNPLRAGAVQNLAEYPWSTWNDKTLPTVHFPAFADVVPDGRADQEAWTMDYFDEAKIRETKLALRRRHFEFPRDAKTKRR